MTSIVAWRSGLSSTGKGAQGLFTGYEEPFADPGSPTFVAGRRHFAAEDETVRRLFLLALLGVTLFAQQPPRRILHVTHSAGFRHSSLELSQQVLRDIAARTGRLEVVATEDLSLLSAAGLVNFDAVFFFTSGELALSDQQKTDLLNFVRSGKGFGGAHSATDTLYTWPEYGELIGGVFDGHPWVHEASIDVEDGTHPISQALSPSWRLLEEYYQFRNFSRDRVRVLMTLDTRTIDLQASGVHRTDEDFALAWIRPYGEGRVFYTALGHFEQTWRDARFQHTIENGLLWITGLIDGDATVPPRGPIDAALPQAVSAGAALEIYGTNLTTGSSLAANGEWKYRLAGTRVRVNGKDAPMYYASPTQINMQFPSDLALGSLADISLTIGEKEFPIGQRPVISATPVIRGIIPNPVFVQIYATGLGELDEAIATGAPAPLGRLVRTREFPRVRIGGRDAEVQFSGLAPGWVALYQVNAILPGDLPAGDLVIQLEIAGQTAEFPWKRQ